MHYLSTSELVAMAWTMTAIALLFTIGRFLIHWHNRKRLGWDDILNGVAAIFLLAFFATWQTVLPPQYQAQLYAMGKSKTKSTPTDPILEAKVNLANGLLFWFCIYSVKASFLALYWSIFEVSSRFRVAWGLAVAYNVLGFVVTVVMRLVVCGHPSDVLNKAKCLKLGKAAVVRMQVTWCVIDGVGDIVLMLLPIVMLSRMFIRRTQKIQLSILFGLVGLNLATNILRTLYTINRDLKRFPHLNAAWPTLQITTAVILCALPCYGNLFSSRKRQNTPQGVTYGSDPFGNSGQSESQLRTSESMKSMDGKKEAKVEVNSMHSVVHAS